VRSTAPLEENALICSMSSAISRSGLGVGLRSSTGLQHLQELVQRGQHRCAQDVVLAAEVLVHGAGRQARLRDDDLQPMVRTEKLNIARLPSGKGVG